MPNPTKPPLPGWEPTTQAAIDSGVHPRSLTRALDALGAESLRWGLRRYNKIADRERAIRDRIKRRNPPPRRRRTSTPNSQATV